MGRDSDSHSERHEDAYDVSVKVCADDMQCRLSFVPKRSGIILRSSVIEDLLGEAGVVAGIDRGAIEKICRDASKGVAVTDAVVACGRVSKRGVGRALKFLVRVSSDHPEYTENSGGRVDFHETHLFQNVRPGQTIAVLCLPRPSITGYTVRGSAIEPEPMLTTPPVRAGSGVQFQEGSDDKEDAFIAVHEGRVIFGNNVISISDELMIDGDVDFSVGHIDFVGFVRIRGDVVDGFNVRSKKGIHVDRVVGNCCLESSGDITIGGMSGRGIHSDMNSELKQTQESDLEASIQCGGTLTARYLHCVSVECEHDVRVHKELMHSVTYAAGCVSVSGTLAGGKCMALAGMELSEAGTIAGIRTELIAGRDFRAERRIVELRRSLEIIQREQQQLNTRISPYLNRNIGAVLPEAAKHLAEHLTRLQELNTTEKDIMSELDSVLTDTPEVANAKINIGRCLNQGVVIRLGNSAREIKDALKGAHSIIEYDGLEIRFLQLTSLLRKSSEIERTMIEKEESAIMKRGKHYGISREDKERSVFIRMIQTSEGFEPCFATKGADCVKSECLFRRECIKTYNAAADESD